MSDIEDDEEDVCIPQLANGMISLFEWISKSRLKLEQEKVALESFEGYQMLVKEIEQKYMKFLASEEKAYVSKVAQNFRRYEKVQSEIQLILAELISSAEMMSEFKTRSVTNRDINSRLRLKLVERKDRKLRSALVKADMGNADRMIKDLQGEFPRIEEIANKLEKRFHHNLGRFIRPGVCEGDLSKVGPPTKPSKTNNKLKKHTELTEVRNTNHERGLVRQGKISTAENTTKMGSPSENQDTPSSSQELNSGDAEDWVEKYKDDIQGKISFSDGPNDKGVQTDVIECTIDYSDGEDVLLVEISEDESDE